MSSTTTLLASEKPYENFQKDGVLLIVVPALISLTAITFLLLTVMSWSKVYKHRHILGCFISLLVANVLQSISTLMNLRWTTTGVVVSGPLCFAQGSLKQAGNLGTALWSLMMSLHLFNLVFLYYPSTKSTFWVMLVVGWFIVITAVVVGPMAIQNPKNGPYFGISGTWCWITPSYRTAQLYLEYFPEFFSATLSFVVCTSILLRVRGNLYFVEGSCYLRRVPRGQRWKLYSESYAVDLPMLLVAQHMVWYPIAYTITIFPIAVSRMAEFAGNPVPFWATIITEMFFNFTGFLNVLILVCARRLFRGADAIPGATAPHKETDPRADSITTSFNNSTQPSLNSTPPRYPDTMGSRFSV